MSLSLLQARYRWSFIASSSIMECMDTLSKERQLPEVKDGRAYPSRGKYKFPSLIVSNSVNGHAGQPILDVHWIEAEVKERVGSPAGSSQGL